MQATLVSSYGEKTGNLFELIRFCQAKLSGLMPASFCPYELEQVHGTLIGLEGFRVGDSIMNENFFLFRQEEKLMSPAKLLDFLRSDHFPSFSIRIGGYRKQEDFGFLSQNRHPFFRSFSIQNEIAVAMGWPYDGVRYPNVLDELRHKFNRLNVLHRWHRNPGAVDNDFYFVLGRVDRRFLSDADVRKVEEEMRDFMAVLDTGIFTIDQSVLSIVGYLDRQLPIQTSCSFKVNDPALNCRKLLGLYPTFKSVA